jgi:hypothetical protein
LIEPKHYFIRICGELPHPRSTSMSANLAKEFIVLLSLFLDA